jgi:hypothetical protein
LWERGPGGEGLDLACEFYRLWSAEAPAQPGARDLEQAAALLREHGGEGARAILACLVQVTRKGWPECRSLSGAARKYLADALKLHAQQQKRAAGQGEARQARQQGKQAEASRRQEDQLRREVWEALPEPQRQAIEARVRARLGDRAPAAFVRRMCLEEVGR